MNMIKIVKSAASVMLLAALLAVANGCGKPKEPPPGGADVNAPPMVDLGPAAAPNQGAGMDPSQAGAGQESQESGIKGQGRAPEEQAPNTGSR